MATGKYLIVRSTDGQDHHFPWPDPTMLGKKDLHVPLEGMVTTTPAWLDVPCFAAALGKFIETERSATAIRNEPLVIPDDISLDDDPLLNNIAHTITLQPWNERSVAIVMLEPRARSNSQRIDVNYLQGTYAKFLKNILYREQHRSDPREDVIAILEARIDAIKRM